MTTTTTLYETIIELQRAARNLGDGDVLELANKMLGGNGLAFIEGNGGYEPDIEYVDLGDPYALTVMYDRVTERFLWGISVHEIVERRGYER